MSCARRRLAWLSSAVMATVVGVAGPGLTHAQEPAAARFVDRTIARELAGGYQVVATDLNGDGSHDLLALASRLDELVWFEGPSWERHVVAGGFSGMINVAARDLDGDEIPELALAHGFGTSPERSLGNLSILRHSGDPTAPWSVREIDRVPTAHRVRWLDLDGGGQTVLINAPLVGAASRPPEYRGATPIYYYRPDDWERRTVTDADAGVVHGIFPARWAATSGESLLSASFIGIHEHRFVDGRWERARLAAGDPSDWPESGASDVAVGSLGDEIFIASIEPWHGHQVVVYSARAGEWQRTVIDDSLEDGHTLVVADFDDDGVDEVVAGARRGQRVTLYRAAGDSAQGWRREILDDGEMAAAGCAASDLDADGDLDLVCIGSATANLKWYENTMSR